MTIEEARKFLDGELLAIALECNVSSETQKKRLEERFAALNVAIGAIDKQIPKKPICSDAGWGKCPICGNTMVEFGEKYCFNCGQAIEWSDYDD